MPPWFASWNDVRPDAADGVVIDCGAPYCSMVVMQRRGDRPAMRDAGGRPHASVFRRGGAPPNAGLVSTARKRERVTVGRGSRGLFARSAWSASVTLRTFRRGLPICNRSVSNARAARQTNHRAVGGFDENHVMVPVSLPVEVFRASSRTPAAQADRDRVRPLAVTGFLPLQPSVGCAGFRCGALT